MKLFEHSNEERVGYTYYIQSPKSLDTAERVKYYDDYARRAIADAEELIKTLQGYRLKLYERFQEIAQANYRLQLKMQRNIDSYRGTKKRYYVELNKIYDRADIRPAAIISEKYEGKDRAKAFARFRELQKQYPQIEHIQDTDKKSWER